MRNGENEKNIIEAAKRGNADAIIFLIRHYQPDLKKFASHICQNSEDVEDAVQHTLFIISSRVSLFKNMSQFSTWLFSIVKNECLKFIRKARYLDEISDTHADPSEPLEQRFSEEQLLEKVTSAVLELEPIYREVFILRDVEGKPTHEVSANLGISSAAVKSRLLRARAEVRAKMKNEV